MNACGNRCFDCWRFPDRTISEFLGDTGKEGGLLYRVVAFFATGGVSFLPNVQERKKAMFRRSVFTLAIAVALVSVRLEAATQGPSPSAPAASVPTPMPLDGTWIVLDEVMLTGDFFSGTWVWDSSETISFTATDLFVASDEFAIFDNGALVAASPAALDWDLLGKGDPFDLPSFTVDPATALANGFFSNLKLKFAPGHHEITIQSTHIPPGSVGGVPFIDGTVAFRAEVQIDGIPAVSEWGFLALAMSLLIGAKLYYGRNRSAVQGS